MAREDFRVDYKKTVVYFEGSILPNQGLALQFQAHHRMVYQLENASFSFSFS